jgi:hypothetical protein
MMTKGGRREGSPVKQKHTRLISIAAALGLLLPAAVGYSSFSDSLSAQMSITVAAPECHRKPFHFFHWHRGYRDNGRSRFDTHFWEYVLHARGKKIQGKVEPQICRSGNIIKVYARIPVAIVGHGDSSVFNKASLRVGTALLFDGYDRNTRFSKAKGASGFDQDFYYSTGKKKSLGFDGFASADAAAVPSEEEEQGMVVSAFSQEDWVIGEQSLADFEAGSSTHDSEPVTFAVYDEVTGETQTFLIQFEVSFFIEENGGQGDTTVTEGMNPVPENLLPNGDPLAKQPSMMPAPPEIVMMPAPGEEAQSPAGEAADGSAPLGEDQGGSPVLNVPADEAQSPADGDANEPTPPGEENAGTPGMEAPAEETIPAPGEVAAFEPITDISKVYYKYGKEFKDDRFSAPFFRYSYTDRSGSRVEKETAPVCHWEGDRLVVYANVYIPQNGTPGAPLLQSMDMSVRAAVRLDNASGADYVVESVSKSGGLNQSYTPNGADPRKEAMTLAPGDSGVISAGLDEGISLSGGELDLESLSGMVWNDEWKMKFRVSDSLTGLDKVYTIQFILSVKTQAPAETPLPTEVPAPAETPLPTEVPAPAETPLPTEITSLAEALQPTDAPAPAEVPEPTEAKAESLPPEDVPKPAEQPSEERSGDKVSGTDAAPAEVPTQQEETPAGGG